MTTSRLPPLSTMDIAIIICILVGCNLIGSNPCPIRSESPFSVKSEWLSWKRLGTTAYPTQNHQQTQPEMEELRAQLQRARGIISQGASSDPNDKTCKTFGGEGEGEA